MTTPTTAMASMASRCALVLAWLVPTLALCVDADCLASLLWAVAWVAPIGAMPRRLLLPCAIASMALSPVILAWSGYASANGLGPGPCAVAAGIGASTADLRASALATISDLSAIGCVAAHAMLCSLSALTARFDSCDPLRKACACAVIPLAFSACADGLRPELAMPGVAMLSSVPATAAGAAKGLALGQCQTSVPESPREAAPRVERAPETVAVLVIGESQRADAFGAAKAGRSKWDAALARRVADGLGAWLPPACSGSDATMDSVPLLVAAAEPAQRTEADRMPTLLMRLKEAGYRTGWFSNNAAVSVGDNRSIEAGADVSWRMQAGAKFWGYDGELVAPASRFAASGGSRAVVMHIQGAHFSYAARYPSGLFDDSGEKRALDSVGMSDEPREGSEANSEAAYDRANAYTASVLDGMAKALDALDTPAFLVFTSDHGENLPSDNNGLRFHMSSRSSVPTSRVPAFALWNRAFARSGRAAAADGLNRANLIAHADVARLFLSLAGVGLAPVPTKDPDTWGSREKGDRRGAFKCSALKP